MYYSLVAMLPSTTGNLKIIYADRLTSIGMLWVATQATISNLRRWGGLLMTFSADPYFDTFLVYAVRNVVFFVSYSHHVFLFTGDVWTYIHDTWIYIYICIYICIYIYMYIYIILLYYIIIYYIIFILSYIILYIYILLYIYMNMYIYIYIFINICIYIYIIHIYIHTYIHIVNHNNNYCLKEKKRPLVFTIFESWPFFHAPRSWVARDIDAWTQCVSERPGFCPGNPGRPATIWDYDEAKVWNILKS